MSTFTVHTPETAPATSRVLLESVRKSSGFIPNLFAAFAESPALLKGYLALSEIFSKETDLDATEQQIVLLTVSFENDCAYCVAGHSVIAKGAGVSDEVVSAVRDDKPLADPRHEALRRFTRELIRTRGWVSQEELDGFLAAGYSNRHVLEVILGAGLKTLSNYNNHIAETPLDAAFQPAAWERPVAAAKA